MHIVCLSDESALLMLMKAIFDSGKVDCRWMSFVLTSQIQESSTLVRTRVLATSHDLGVTQEQPDTFWEISVLCVVA